jgi:predicted component of type VI protein secretion system
VFFFKTMATNNPTSTFARIKKERQEQAAAALNNKAKIDQTQSVVDGAAEDVVPYPVQVVVTPVPNEVTPIEAVKPQQPSNEVSSSKHAEAEPQLQTTNNEAIDVSPKVVVSSVFPPPQPEPSNDSNHGLVGDMKADVVQANEPTKIVRPSPRVRLIEKLRVQWNDSWIFEQERRSNFERKLQSNEAWWPAGNYSN